MKIDSISKLISHVDAKKRDEFPGYISSLIHHIGISPACLFVIARDYLAFNHSGGLPFDVDHSVSFHAPNGLFAFTFGYFVGDSLLFSIPEMFKPGFASKVYFIHHFGAMSMVYVTFCRSQGRLVQVFAGMMCTEMSSIFFGVAMIMRALGCRDWKSVSVIEKMFAFSFFLLRNGHLTLLIYLLWHDIAVFGGFQYAIIVSMGLQFFWAYKIVMSLASPQKRRSKEA